MNLIPSSFKELKATLILAAPIAAGHLGQMVLGFSDTLMIGRVGVVPLAASAFANSLVHFFFIAGIGLLTSISVLVSHAFGAKDHEEAGFVCHRGIWLGLISGFVVAGLTLLTLPFLNYLGQDPLVVEESRFYLITIASSMPFALLLISLKAYSEAINLPWTAFWASLWGILLNIFLNWVLIYGNLGFPAMGLDGAGIGTLIARIVTIILAFYWILGDTRFQATLPKRWFVLPQWGKYKEMFVLGMPVGLQLFVEVGTFGIATILAGTFGVVALAAHQIVLTCAAMTFMIPLGVGIAVTVRIGQVLGAKERNRARRIGFSSIGLIAGMSFVNAALFIGFNKEIVSVFTLDTETIALASYLIIIAGFFQLFDGTQVVAMGALRGSKDVHIPTGIAVFSFVGVALGGGSVLAYLFDLGVRGIWFGLAGGLGIASILLIIRFAWITRKGMTF